MSVQQITQPTRKPPSEFNVRAGRILRLKRVGAGLSQETVGDRMGISHQCYQRYESGGIVLTIPGVVKLGKAIGFCPLEFFGQVLSDRTPIRKIKEEMKDGWAAKAAKAMSDIPDVKDRKMVLALAKRLSGKK